MIIIMSGYPGCGKTEVANKLFENYESDNSHKLLNMHSRIPNNLDNLELEIRREITLAAWEEVMDKFRHMVNRKDPFDMMILDTCCATTRPVSVFIKRAQKNGHKVVTVFVNRNLKNCIAASKDMEEEDFEKYTSKFKTSLPSLKSLSDKFIRINNDEDLQSLYAKAEKVRDKLCHNSSTPQTVT